MTTQARELAGIISNAGDLNFSDDITLGSDASVLNFGADSEVTVTHVHNTGLLVNSTRQLQFGDSGTYINQSGDGVLNITSDTEVEINATTVDINANVDISGNLVLGGNITIGDADSDDISFGGELTSHIIPNADNTYDLGSSTKEWRNAYFDGTVTSDAFAGPLTGDVTGNVTGNVSGTAATVTTAAQTNITSLGTLTALTVDNVSINGTTIGHTGDTDLITLASNSITMAGEVVMNGKAAISTLVTDNDGSFDMDACNDFKCTPSGNFTLTFTNIQCQSGNILLVNSGGHTVSAHANTKVDANLLATVTAAGTYLISYFSDGTNAYLTNSAIYT